MDSVATNGATKPVLGFGTFREAVSLAEQIGALNPVRAAGKVRHIGVSNFNTTLIAAAIKLSAMPLVTNQIEYHPYLDQAAMIKAARKEGPAVTG
jgi:2,5-diketo-D-gluconate reductase B